MWTYIFTCGVLYNCDLSYQLRDAWAVIHRTTAHDDPQTTIQPPLPPSTSGFAALCPGGNVTVSTMSATAWPPCHAWSDPTDVPESRRQPCAVLDEPYKEPFKLVGTVVPSKANNARHIPTRKRGKPRARVKHNTNIPTPQMSGILEGKEGIEFQGGGMATMSLRRTTYRTSTQFSSVFSCCATSAMGMRVPLSARCRLRV